MVHQYQLNGYNIVLDTCSGAIHVVDEVAYDIIALYPDHTADEIVTAMMEKYGAREDVTEKDLRDCIDDVEALKQAGKLYTPDTFADMAGTFKERSGDVVKALCLHVAHTCNLNCSYCFASQGKYHGDRALMSFEVGKQALDFLMDHSGSRTNLEVDFFGGEPLMNWDVVKQLVEYARSVEKERGKNFRFTLTTNGMLIDDDVIDFANREMSNVVLSLDGRKEIHDRLRVDYAGNGSYERIVPKFQKLVEARGNKNYYMRGTFTHANPDFTKDLFHMADLGFTELSMEPVVCAPEDPAALTAEDLEIVKDQYELLAKDMLRREKEGKPITFYHYMLDLTGGPCIYKRISGCGSGISPGECKNSDGHVWFHQSVLPGAGVAGSVQPLSGGWVPGSPAGDVWASGGSAKGADGCRLAGGTVGPAAADRQGPSRDDRRAVGEPFAGERRGM